MQPPSPSPNPVPEPRPDESDGARPGTGIILAAGASRRMGSPKALLPLHGRPLILHHLDALSAWCGRLVVVSGAHRDEIGAVLPAGVTHLFNPAWAHTRGRASLLIALATLPDAATVMIAPVDTPPVSRAVGQALWAAGPPAVPVVADAPGHPVLGRVADLRAGLAAGTLRDALAAARRVPVDDPDVLVNLNHPHTWRAWRRRRERAP